MQANSYRDRHEVDKSTVTATLIDDGECLVVIHDGKRGGIESTRIKWADIDDLRRARD